MTNAYTLKGDVNKDGVVNVVDATLIQKYIAHEVEFTGAQKMLTNVAKYESDISVIAATDLQKFIVGLNGDFETIIFSLTSRMVYSILMIQCVGMLTVTIIFRQGTRTLPMVRMLKMSIQTFS